MSEQNLSLGLGADFFFVVYGRAKPAGSKRAFVVKGRAIVTDANPNSRDWKNQVADAARHFFAGPLLDCPLAVRFVFFTPRPKGHFNSKGGLNGKGQATPFPAKAPDALKLARGVEDALKGIVYRDDCLIVKEQIEKRWGEPARCEIEVRSM